MKLPVLAIVGRPNVGKSTIFNRLSGEQISIVQDIPGITRDRIYSRSEWNGQLFHLIDTGGLEFGNDEEFLDHIRKQAEIAISEADVILFVTDANGDITSTDEEVAKRLRQSNKPVVLAVNKIDNHNQLSKIYEYYKLGFKNVFGISSLHGTGTGDMLDEIVSLFPPEQESEYSEDTIKVSVIGRPNVGKSMLVNSLLGEERVIVSSIAGTTRDAVDTPLTHDDQDYVLIDTAGIRRKGKVSELIEKYSVIRSIRAIERSDVCLVMLDAESGLIEQDKKIAGYAHEAGRACILVVNKWDMIEKDGKTMEKYRKEVSNYFKYMDYAPIMFVSAKYKHKIHNIFPSVYEVAQQHAMRVSTSALNQVLQEAITFSPPPMTKGHRPKILYGTQVSVKPPTFIIFANRPELVHFSYLRYLENQFRKSFAFTGTPIRLTIKGKNEGRS